MSLRTETDLLEEVDQQYGGPDSSMADAAAAAAGTGDLQSAERLAKENMQAASSNILLDSDSDSDADSEHSSATLGAKYGERKVRWYRLTLSNPP